MIYLCHQVGNRIIHLVPEDVLFCRVGTKMLLDLFIRANSANNKF